MTDDVILNKITNIERCINRIQEEYDKDQFESNFTIQDAVILNIQRACESSIDLATHIVRIRSLGVPQSSREVFVLLEQATIISPELSKKLQAMVGFRNIAVHNYTQLNIEIVRSIVESKLRDFLELTQIILKNL